MKSVSRLSPFLNKVYAEHSKNKKTPRVIIQTWKTKKLPSHLKRLYDEWEKDCKEYSFSHVLYTDEDLRNVIKTHFPIFLDMYDSFTNPLERVDFARYAILFIHGGVYSDLDIVPIKPITSLIETNKIVLATEPKEHSEILYSNKKVLCNAFMISPPGERMWLHLLQHIHENYKPYWRVVYNTGPMALTALYESQPELFRNIIILNACSFYPLIDERYGGKTQTLNRTGEVFHNVSKECNINESYVAHMWNHDGYQGFDMEFLDPRNWAIALVIIFIILFMFPPHNIKWK